MKAQNIAREIQMNRSPARSLDDTFKKNYELGIIHGQRSVLMLPITIVQIRDEEVQQLLSMEQKDDERTDG